MLPRRLLPATASRRRGVFVLGVLGLVKELEGCGYAGKVVTS